MQVRRLFFVVPLSLLLSLAGCASAPGKPVPILATVPSGELQWIGDLPVIRLHGTPYDMGYQHGSLLRAQVRASVRNVMAFADRQAGIPGMGRWLVRRRLDKAWSQMEPFVPAHALEEMQGLADGAGIPLKALERIHALPDLTSATCASFAASGAATRDGRLIHIRNLDWAIQSGVQSYAALMVVEPNGGRPFVNIGWLGFIGVITGINQQGISVSEIGAKTVDTKLEGIPMPFLLRRVLEEAGDLDKAVEIVKAGPRTGGYNYLFGDAKARTAVALETTRNHCAVFRIDEEPSVPYSLHVPNAIFRSDWSLDPEVRNLQLASNGRPSLRGLESPRGSSAYEVRYHGQGALLLRFQGSLDPEVGMAIARAIAPSSNIQSVVYAYPQIWVANASGRHPAAGGRFLQVDLEELFSSRKRNE